MKCAITRIKDCASFAIVKMIFYTIFGQEKMNSKGNKTKLNFKQKSQFWERVARRN